MAPEDTGETTTAFPGGGPPSAEGTPDEYGGFFVFCRETLYWIAVFCLSGGDSSELGGVDPVAEFERQADFRFFNEWKAVKSILDRAKDPDFRATEKEIETCLENINLIISWFFVSSGMLDRVNKSAISSHVFLIEQRRNDAWKRLIHILNVTREELRQHKQSSKQLLQQIQDQVRPYEVKISSLRDQISSQASRIQEQDNRLQRAREENEESAKIAEANQRELRETQKRLEGEKAQVSSLVSQLEEQRNKLQEAQEKLREQALRSQIAAPPSAPATTSPTPPTTTPPPVAAVSPKQPLPTRPRVAWWIGGVAALGLVVVAIQTAQRKAPREEEGLLPVESGAPEPSLPVPPPASVSGSAPNPPATPLVCPAGMELFRKRSHRLVQPERPGWPAALKATTPEQVEDFCIQKRMVAVDDYEQCVKRGICTPLKTHKEEACWWDNKLGKPVLCRTHAEASAYCNSQNWTLPSVLQLEVAHKARALHTFSQTGEWSREAFPAPVFQRGPAIKDCKKPGQTCFMIHALEVDEKIHKGLEIGWNRDVGEVRRADIGFRCVVEISPHQPPTPPMERGEQ